MGFVRFLTNCRQSDFSNFALRLFATPFVNRHPLRENLESQCPIVTAAVGSAVKLERPLRAQAVNPIVAANGGHDGLLCEALTGGV
jgi:hypothetical protein